MATEEITRCSAFEPGQLGSIKEETNSGNNSNSNVNRRSLSIFSRRGTETPKPQIDRMPSVISRPKSTITTPRRQSTKMFRTRKLEPQIPEGTILRAVPPAASTMGMGRAGRSMSTLELEMATSPNEEILNAIGIQTPVESPVSPNSPYLCGSPSDYPPRSPSQSNRLPLKRSRTRSNSVKDNVIGVWKGGKTQWMHESFQAIIPQKQTRPAAEMWAEPSMDAATVGAALSDKTERPRIQVIIPTNRMNAPLPSLPFFSTPMQSYGSVDATISADPSSASSVDVPMGSISRTTTITRSTSDAFITYQPQPQRPASMMVRSLANADQQSLGSVRNARLSLRASSSSSEGSSSKMEDDGSNYDRSERSSMTSVGSDKMHNWAAFKPKSLGDRTGSQMFSITSPAAAGIYDSGSATTDASFTYSPFIAELPGSSPSDRMTLSRASSQALPQRRWSKKRMSSRRGTTFLSAPPTRKSSKGSDACSPSWADAEHDLESALNSMNESRSDASPVGIDEAILIAELPAEPCVAPPLPPKSKRRSTVAYRQYKGPAVTPAIELPRHALAERSKTLRNRRRDLQNRSLRKKRSVSMPAIDQLVLAEVPEPTTEELEQQREEERKRKQCEISAQQAEEVILRILESLTTLEDLFNAARLNKGFYRVFKRHEMDLLWSGLKYASLPAWEYMRTVEASSFLDDDEQEILSPAEYTPTMFLRCLVDAHAILIGLKSLLLARCQSFLRSSTIDALSDMDAAASERVDSALWRIFTFCRIFGHDRGREDDLIGQMDWLRGGALAHQQTCTSTILSSDSFGLSDVLLNAAEHFGRGNGATGLTAEDLYDMTELWNCMNWLVRGLEGRTDQARQYGIFDNTDVRGGDIDGEEAMLEEYASYLLTLGPETILTIASVLQSDDDTLVEDMDTDATAFFIAKNNGWAKWSPPVHGATRANFLKEPLSRLYEERIQAAFASSDRQEAEARNEEMKELRRQHGHILADELKRSRPSGEEQRRQSTLRPLKLSDERPMSNWEPVLTKLAQSEANSQASSANTPSYHSMEMITPGDLERDNNASDGRSTPGTMVSATSAPHLLYNKEYGPASLSSSKLRLAASIHSVGHSSAASSTTSLSDIHPAFREEVAQARTASRGTMHSSNPDEHHSTLGTPYSAAQSSFVPSNEQLDPAADTADKAVRKIVEMGFTSEQARFALMKTDVGSGLQVERAVELLLRQQGEA